MKLIRVLLKKLPFLLIPVLVLSLFAGCGAEPESTDAAGTTAAAPTETAAVTAADVHPMLFRVTGENGKEGYLFGTIHVGDARSKVALQKLTPYLDSCDALAVEFDVLAYEKDMSAQMKSMATFVLTDGTKITDWMPKELYDRACALLNEAKLMPNMMSSYNLSMWQQLVENAALLTRSDYDVDLGMDRALIQYCYDRQIEVRDVESAELQFGMMAGFSNELNLMLIENTLDSLDEYGEGIDRLYRAWLEGDAEQLTEILLSEEGGDELTEAEAALMQEYYDQMLTQRNLGMRDKAAQWLQAGDRVFFAVGALHLVGEDGLVALLRAAGYTVEQLSYEN